MRWFLSGDEDVNIVGVVGASSEGEDEPKASRTERPKSGQTNTTIKHYGRGQVNINNK